MRSKKIILIQSISPWLVKNDSYFLECEDDNIPMKIYDSQKSNDTQLAQIFYQGIITDQLSHEIHAIKSARYTIADRESKKTEIYNFKPEQMETIFTKTAKKMSSVGLQTDREIIKNKKISNLGQKNNPSKNTRPKSMSLTINNENIVHSQKISQKSRVLSNKKIKEVKYKLSTHIRS